VTDASSFFLARDVMCPWMTPITKNAANVPTTDAADTRNALVISAPSDGVSFSVSGVVFSSMVLSFGVKGMDLIIVRVILASFLQKFPAGKK